MTNCAIPFTQYLLPHGDVIEVSIVRPQDIYDKAMDIVADGYRFEIELLTNGLVSMTITDDDGDQDCEIVGNGPEVPVAVDRMITRFFERRKNRGNLD